MTNTPDPDTPAAEDAGTAGEPVDDKPEFEPEVNDVPSDYEPTSDLLVVTELDELDADPMMDEQPEPATPVDGEPGQLESAGSPLGAIDPAVSDDELLAAASSSLHDEADMVNSIPDGAGPTPNDPPTSATSGSAQANHDTGSGALPPPPTPPSAPGGYQPGTPFRRLYRSRNDRKLGGVSAGIAEYFRIDPTLVRLATLLAAFTGVGILVYIAAWFIVPLRPEGFVDAPPSAPVANERTMTLAFGIAALALAFGIATGSWAVLAIALIGGGVWLLSEHTASAPGMAGVAQVPGVSQYQAPTGFEPAYGSAPAAPYAAASPTVYPPPPAPGPQPPVAERKPQRITWIVLSLLALLAAVGVAAATGDWWDVSATRFLGIGVVIIGIGVVAGQLQRGGARGLIPLGILGALALFPVAAVDGLLDDGVGDAHFSPTAIAELETKYEHGIGQMTVDLSALDFAGRTDSVDIDLGIGELIVILSEDTGGMAVLDANAGEVMHTVPGTSSASFEEGINVETPTIVLTGENGDIDLNISVGLGTAELRFEDN